MRGKSCGSEIRALWGPRWARLPRRRDKYCHNGGIAVAHQSTASLVQISCSADEVAEAIITVMAPIAAPPKVPDLQE
jgi:hypothetical protein